MDLGFIASLETFRCVVEVVEVSISAVARLDGKSGTLPGSIQAEADLPARTAALPSELHPAG